MKQRQVKARTRQKARKLKLKSLALKIWERLLNRRRQAIKEQTRERGQTITGIRAADVAHYIPPGTNGQLFDYSWHKRLNQRQKRKRARQNGRPLKRKA